MEMTPHELAELKGIFRTECDEHLGALNGLLMALEQDPGDAQTLNETFRRIHSVKGAARMVGFAGIEAVAHGLEALLAQVRDGMRPLTKEALALIFDGADAMTDLMNSGTGTAVAETPVRAMLVRIAEFDGGSIDVDVAPENGAPTNGKVVANGKPATNGKSKPARKNGKRAAVAQPNPVTAFAPSEVRSAQSEIAAAAEARPAPRDEIGGDTVRVGAEKIDRLIALRGELLRQFAADENDLEKLGVVAANVTAAMDALRAHLGPQAADGAANLFEDLQRRRQELIDAAAQVKDRDLRRFSLLEDLRDRLADLRMLPAATVLQPLARIVRDVALLQDKQADLVISGGDVALDKVVLEAIKEPLIHLVRNAVAHGIELPEIRLLSGKPSKGTVRVSVSTGTASATIIVEDDGAGIDVEAVRRQVVERGFTTVEEAAVLSDQRLTQYLFKPGFSTAQTADEISGRGVGLDVVADRVAQLRGSYHVESGTSSGTRFVLRVPVSLLTSSVLAVRAGTTEVYLRQTDIHEAVLIKPEHVVNVEGRITVTVRDEIMPVIPLASIAGGPAQVFFGRDGVVPAIVIKDGERKAAVVVDALAGLSEVIVKPMPRPLGRVPGVAGYAISLSGQPLCVLDGEVLVRNAHDRGAAGAIVHEKTNVKRRLLIADDSLTTRTLLRNIMISAGYEVETAIDGVDAWNKLAGSSFDCIMSDLEMPNMSGWEFCERIKRDPRYSSMPVVLVTSLSKEEERRRGLELGADAYIVKGLFNETQLLETVERLVA
jgi:two-component system chemotaxis sensor kinase CheA